MKQFEKIQETQNNETKQRSKRANDLAGKEWLQNSISIWSGIKKTPEEIKLAHPAMFPVNLVLRILKSFTRSDEHIVLDPFLGSGTTLLAAKSLGKCGIGFDVSTEYVTLARTRLNSQSELFDTNEVESRVILDDARNIGKHIKKETVDICVTSPPYWDILKQKRSADMKATRDYAPSEGNIGEISSYTLFLRELSLIFEGVYIALKQGGYCIVNVMDIRKRSNFYPLHSDFADQMQSVGFIFDDLIIWDRRHEYNNFRPLGYPAVFRINRAHEYLLIFRKK